MSTKMNVEKEYEGMIHAYEKAGGVQENLQGKNAHLLVHENKVLNANEVPGIKLNFEQTENGIIAELCVEEGSKIEHPVHLCFGVLPKDGLQEIVFNADIQSNSEVNIVAHCIFPNAVNVIHKMDAVIKIGDNAKFNYHETHYHGESGGVKVLPKAKIYVGKGGLYKSAMTLIDGCVGMLDYDFEVFGDEKSVSELEVKVYGQKEDDIRIVEKINLNGRDARGMAKSRLVLNDNAKAEVIGETYGNAPFSVGHVDCLEIVNGEGVVAKAVPVVLVKDRLAKVTHEAAIGSIDKKQMQTLMARGLDEEAATDVIVKGILR